MEWQKFEISQMGSDQMREWLNGGVIIWGVIKWGMTLALFG